MIKRAVPILAAALALAAAPLAAEKLSLSFNGAVADGAGVLSDQFEKEMNDKLERFEEQTDASIILITTPGLQEVDTSQAAERIGNEMREAGHIKAHWIVFLLAPANREFTAKINIPPGPTADALAEEAQDEARMQALLEEMVALWPEAVEAHFKDDNWEAGLRAGVDAMIGSLDADDPADDDRTV